MTNSNEAKLAWITEQIEAGRTVYFCTALRATPFTAKSIAKFRALGVEPIKLGSTGDLRMLEGFTKGKPRFVCANYCELRAQ